MGEPRFFVLGLPPFRLIREVPLAWLRERGIEVPGYEPDVEAGTVSARNYMLPDGHITREAPLITIWELDDTIPADPDCGWPRG